MKVKTHPIPFIYTIFLIVIGCSSDLDDEIDQCISFRTENVVAVDAPSSAMVDEMVDIEVKFRVFNGCGGFGSFIETGNNFERTIVVEARYEGCICTQNIPIITTNFQFTPRSVGEYKLRFKSSTTEFIIVNIVVN